MKAFAECVICSGQFCGDEIEPGTFHESCVTQRLRCSKADRPCSDDANERDSEGENPRER